MKQIFFFSLLLFLPFSHEAAAEEKIAKELKSKKNTDVQQVWNENFVEDSEPKVLELNQVSITKETATHELHQPITGDNVPLRHSARTDVKKALKTQKDLDAAAEEEILATRAKSFLSGYFQKQPPSMYADIEEGLEPAIEGFAADPHIADILSYLFLIRDRGGVSEVHSLCRNIPELKPFCNQDPLRFLPPNAQTGVQNIINPR